VRTNSTGPGDAPAAPGPGDAQPASPAPATSGRRGAVASPHHLASEAGLDALRAGGTAIDAALAAAAVLAVVYPHMCSLGGDAFALVRSPAGEVSAINGSGSAPGGVDPVALRRVYRRMPITGPLSVTVPGVLAAWATLLALGGRLGLARALEPAIGHARDGVPVSASLRRALVADQAELASAAGIRDIFLPGGHLPPEGFTFRQPALAHSLEAIADRGADDFYRGKLGEQFVQGMQALGSPLSMADLATHKTVVGEPLSGSYRGWQVLTPPPNSQGFVLLEILAALEGLTTSFDPAGADAPIVAELFRQANADRDRHLSAADVPVATLLSADSVEELRARVRERAKVVRPAHGPPLGRDTVAICATDDSGWAVVLIQSIFHAFGARILEPDTGIIAQNRGAAFSLESGAGNTLAPGRRPPHTLMPVAVMRRGRLAYLVGTMGGKAQPQILAEILARLLDLGQALGDALSAPRWVLGGLEVGSVEGTIRLEGRLGRMRRAFEDGGFPVEILSDFDEEVGQVQAIQAGTDGFVAESDPRSDGAGLAW
jgi:gamma-glutamyltranspeptidase